MSGPKMQNAYPTAISTYPTWVAHETPYTAEWGTSVGYEFYLIEYELGEAPRGSYNSVKERLDSFPEFYGFNYWARGYYFGSLGFPADHDIPIYFEFAQHDIDSVFDLVGRRNITAKVDGWYEINWNVFLEITGGAFPVDIQMEVKKSICTNYYTVGYDFKVIERAGWYTMNVHGCTYLHAGQYVYGHITATEDLTWYTRGDRAALGVTIKLLDAVDYDVRTE